MTDPELMKVAGHRVEIELRERREIAGRELAQIKADLGFRGSLHSSGAQTIIQQAIAAEFEQRAALIWQILARIISGEPLQIDASVGDEFKSFVKAYLYDSDDLKGQYDWAVNIRGGAHHLRPFEELRSRAFEKVSSEIDIALLKARQRPTDGKTTVNIYQPFGIIQTGAGSSATFTQHFGATEKDQIARALVAVEEAISKKSELQPAVRVEVQEVVDDARAEISKTAPNLSRLRGALLGIGATIQTLGSAAPAYQILKAAAALVGVTLP